jgi:hypothetical protein
MSSSQGNEAATDHFTRVCSGFGNHGKCIVGLSVVDMRSQTVAGVAAWGRPLVAIVPLAVQVVRHVNNVIQGFCHLLDRE